MPYLADRVKETTTSTGTGSVTLAGAASGFQSFNTAFPNAGTAGQMVGYCIVGTTEWEVGKGLFIAPSTLQRLVIRSSSNGGNLVNFSAGTKDVFVTASAEHLDNANTGMQMAGRMNLFMP
jgi:hypothetical protein